VRRLAKRMMLRLGTRAEAIAHAEMGLVDRVQRTSSGLRLSCAVVGGRIERTNGAARSGQPSRIFARLRPERPSKYVMNYMSLREMSPAAVICNALDRLSGTTKG
jgi:hypothetical protein